MSSRLAQLIHLRTPKIGGKAYTNQGFTADDKPFALSALRRLYPENELISHVCSSRRYIPMQTVQKRIWNPGPYDRTAEIEKQL